MGMHSPKWYQNRPQGGHFHKAAAHSIPPTHTVKEVCQLHHVFSYFCFTLPKIFKLQDKETQLHEEKRWRQQLEKGTEHFCLAPSLQEDANQFSNIFTGTAQQLSVPKAVFTMSFPYIRRFPANRTSPCLMAHFFSEEDCIAHIYPFPGQHICTTWVNCQVFFNNSFGSNEI